MTAPVRTDDTPRLEDFPYRLSANVRFDDLDPHGHVNNAVYASYFETGRVTLVKDRSMGLMPAGLGWIMVRLDIHFRAELHCRDRSSSAWSQCSDGRRRPSIRCFSEGRCVVGEGDHRDDRRGDAEADAAAGGGQRTSAAGCVAA